MANLWRTGSATHTAGVLMMMMMLILMMNNNINNDVSFISAIITVQRCRGTRSVRLGWGCLKKCVYRWRRLEMYALTSYLYSLCLCDMFDGTVYQGSTAELFCTRPSINNRLKLWCEYVTLTASTRCSAIADAPYYWEISLRIKSHKKLPIASLQMYTLFLHSF